MSLKIYRIYHTIYIYTYVYIIDTYSEVLWWFWSELQWNFSVRLKYRIVGENQFGSRMDGQGCSPAFCRSMTMLLIWQCEFAWVTRLAILLFRWKAILSNNVHIHIWVYMYIFICVCKNICICVCMYIYIYCDFGTYFPSDFTSGGIRLCHAFACMMRSWDHILHWPFIGPSEGFVHLVRSVRKRAACIAWEERLWEP